MKIFYFLVRASRREVALSIVAGALSGLTNLALLIMMSDALSGRGSTAFLDFISLCVFMLLFKVGSEIISLQLALRTTYNLRRQLWAQILAVPLRKQEELGSHRLVSALTGDVFTITNFVTYVPNLIMSITLVIGSLIYLGSLSWIVLLIVLGFIVLEIGSYQLSVKRADLYFRLVRAAQDVMFKQFRGLTEGIKELKLHRERRRKFSEEYDVNASSQLRFSLISGSIFAAASAWVNIVYLILIGVFVFVLPGVRLLGSEVALASILILLFIKGPLESIVGVLPNMASTNVAIQNINELGLSLIESREPESDKSPKVTPSWQSLELVDVSHAYKGDREDHNFVLGPISLCLHAGEMVYVAGGNGSGKTTLAKILAGLYIPENGQVRLGGEPITDDNREAYRQNFSAVFSDYYLFGDLLGSGDNHIDREAQKQLVKLELDHKVRVDQGILSTTDLSQGQRKRLALMSACLEDRPIYIFDEWAADQDPHFKDIFYHQLLPELKAKGKTLIVISHDDRYYHLADRVFKLDSGQITATHGVQTAKMT
jgi:putative ATP-binding cassette transporter